MCALRKLIGNYQGRDLNIFFAGSVNAMVVNDGNKVIFMERDWSVGWEQSVQSQQ